MQAPCTVYGAVKLHPTYRPGHQTGNGQSQAHTYPTSVGSSAATQVAVPSHAVKQPAFGVEPSLGLMIEH